MCDQRYDNAYGKKDGNVRRVLNVGRRSAGQ